MEASVDDERRAQFVARVVKRFDRSDTGARAWSSVHHSATVISILFSAGAAFLIKNTLPGMSEGDTQTIAAILAFVAALTTTLGAALGFYRKWKVNVTTRAALGSLITVLETDPTFSLKEAGLRLNAIEERHSQGIISEDKPEGPPPSGR